MVPTKPARCPRQPKHRVFLVLFSHFIPVSSHFLNPSFPEYSRYFFPMFISRVVDLSLLAFVRLLILAARFSTGTRNFLILDWKPQVELLVQSATAKPRCAVILPCGFPVLP